MPKVRVIGRSGGPPLELDLRADQPLMEALRDANLGVAGTCGGACACGTCHVYVRAGAARLPPRSDDEQMMLEAIGELVEVRSESRLSCQLAGAAVDGLEVEIGPVA